MKRKASVLLLVLAVALMLVGNAVAADTSGAETWQVAVGKETASSSLDSMFPKVTYIHEGDKVVFTNGAKFTPHTVTFLAGQPPLSPMDPSHAVPTAASGGNWDGKTLLNSGIMLAGKTYEITFSASGAYSFYCVLHPMMTGTVVVIPKGQPIPGKVEQAAAAKAQETELLAQVQVLEGAKAPEYTVNANGTLTYKVGMGSAQTTMSHNRMMPDLVVVSAGDSVEWINYSPYEPHFVTFNKPKDMNFFSPKGDFNPKFMAPAGGKEFNGTGLTNSGMVMGGQSYTLKFTKAGTFTYECYLHSGSKMTGTVVVVPKNAVKLVVNGKAVADSAMAQWKNGSLNVSIASFAKACGSKITMDGKSGNVSVNGKKLQTAGYVQKGVQYASAEGIARALGGTYAWNEKTQTLTVTTMVAAAANANAGHTHH